ncbi:MAG TPA: 7-carboxy-7-deazaguanine synthase QueE [Nitrososphaeraceae archaeon]|nr:7-carboxy-7-deazaguanine synthase QueE [Nitrososphaeraceae archaeon]
MQTTVNRVQLSEIFTSIEGEGILIGTKTLFIRMAGCHLGCIWCDTGYALPLNSGKEYTLGHVKDMISNELRPNTYKANFTGGEPLLQHYAVANLARFIKDKGLKTYLESSCFDSHRFEKVLPFIDICKIEFKMRDSKAVDSEHHDRLLINERECLDLSIECSKTTYIKVVVTASSSIGEFRNLLQDVFTHIETRDLAGFIIQPSSAMDEPSLKKLLMFYDAVYPIYHNVRIIPQLHKLMGVR